MNNRQLKIGLAFGLILCLLEMPYWYYQLIRIFGTIIFFYFAYTDYTQNIKYTPQTFFVAGVLLNPIIKISFGKIIWNVVDIVLSVIIVLSIVFDSKLKSAYSNRA